MNLAGVGTGGDSGRQGWPGGLAGYCSLVYALSAQGRGGRPLPLVITGEDATRIQCFQVFGEKTSGNAGQYMQSLSQESNLCTAY